MTTIPETRTTNGYNYRLVERRGMAAIYAQYTGKRLLAFEVVKIRVRKAGVFKGKAIPAGERLPSDNDWGTWGWTYSVFGSWEQSAMVAAKALAVAKLESVVADATKSLIRATGHKGGAILGHV